MKSKRDMIKIAGKNRDIDYTFFNISEIQSKRFQDQAKMYFISEERFINRIDPQLLSQLKAVMKPPLHSSCGLLKAMYRKFFKVKKKILVKRAMGTIQHILEYYYLKERQSMEGFEYNVWNFLPKFKEYFISRNHKKIVKQAETMEELLANYYELKKANH